MPSVLDVVDRNFRALDKKDLNAQKRLAAMYADALEAVVAEHKKFSDYVARAKEAGLPVSPSWAARDARFLALQSKLYRAMQEFGSAAAQTIQISTGKNAKSALNGTRAEVKAGEPKGTIKMPGYGAEAWAVINHKALIAADRILKDWDSPLRKLLERDLPESALAMFRKEWMSGLALGKNPLVIARSLHSKIAQLSLGRAQLIARTEMHRAYREGKREQYQQSDVVSGWIWRCALGPRSCVVCIAMHGSMHAKSEILEGHPSCRCIMVPITKSWEEMGYGNMPAAADTRANILWEDPGEAWFARQPPDYWLSKLGPTRYKQYLEGVPIRSMITRVEHPEWGGMMTLAPIKQKNSQFSQGGEPPIVVTAEDIKFLEDTAAYEASLEAVMDTKWDYLEEQAVKYYQSSEYRQLNSMLRDGADYFYKPQRDAMAGLDKAISKAVLQHDIITYRGMSLSSVGELRVGASFPDLAYTSTSTSFDTALAFTKVGAGKSSAVIRVRLRRGQHALNVDAINEYGEQEVLLPRGSTYRITKQLPDHILHGEYGMGDKRVQVWEAEVDQP